MYQMWIILVQTRSGGYKDILGDSKAWIFDEEIIAETSWSRPLMVKYFHMKNGIKSNTTHRQLTSRMCGVINDCYYHGYYILNDCII